MGNKCVRVCKFYIICVISSLNYPFNMKRIIIKRHMCKNPKYVNFRIDLKLENVVRLRFENFARVFPHKTFCFMAAIDWLVFSLSFLFHLSKNY